jgi:hypothetical protein
LVKGWDGTGGVAAEYSVAKSRDDGVAELTYGPGEAGQEVAEAAPAIQGVAKDMQRADNGVGTAVEALVVGEGVGNEDDALWCAGGGGHGDELAGEGALKRGEAEFVAKVVAEDEAHDTVAEGTDAIVEEDRTAFDLGAFHFSHRLWSLRTLILCRCRLTLLFPVRCNFEPNDFFLVA